MKRDKILLGVCTFIIALIFVAFNSKSTSPLFVYRFIDSDIFRYIGYAILHGKAPYVDLFDHKGILLYWINTLGYILNSEVGIFILQVLHLMATLVVWYKMLSLYKQEWVKFFILIISLALQYTYYDEGNLAEEWSLLFISLPIMLWLELWKTKKEEFSKNSMLIIGLCLGALSLLRLNNTIPVVALLVCCLIQAIIDGKYQYVRKGILYITLSFAILPLIACCFMFLLKGIEGIDTMFYAMITFNMDYAKECGLGYQVIRNNIIFYGTPFIPVLFILPLIKTECRMVVPLLLAFTLTILSIGGSGYHHYLLIFIPLQIACFALIPICRFKYLAISTMTIVNCYLVYDFGYVNAPMFKKDTDYDAFCKILKQIPESKRSEIWNMGGAYLARDFMKAGIVQQNRMLLPFQLSTSERLYQEEAKKVQKVKPRYIISATFSNEKHNTHLRYTDQSGYKESDSDYQFMISNYKVIASSEREDGSILFCYQLKNNK